MYIFLNLINKEAFVVLRINIKLKQKNIFLENPFSGL